MIQLDEWLNHSQQASRNDQIEFLRTQAELQVAESHLSPGLDHRNPDQFFSQWALQGLLIGQILPKESLETWLKGLEEIDMDDFSPVEITKESAVHRLGINASRAWGLHKIYQVTGDETWKKVYKDHVQVQINLHDDWKDDRYSYSHWVPQFTLYAMSMEMKPNADL